MNKNMKKSLLLSAALFALASCASSGNQVLKDQTTDTVAAKITKGTSSKNDVKVAFGDPTSTSFTDGGNEIWNYAYAKATAKAVNFVPIVGIFAGGADVDKKTLVILFDDTGVVKNYTLSSSQEEVKRGLLNN